MQELLQSCALSKGTTVSCSVSEVWAVGGRHEMGAGRAGLRGTKQGQEDTAARGEVVRGPRDMRPKEGSSRWELQILGSRQGSVTLKSEEDRNSPTPPPPKC